MKDFIVCLAHN